MPDINGIPYVDSTDLVSGWPATSQSVAQEVSDQLASKVDYALPVNAQTGTTYTFVAADAEKLTTASNAAAVTLTIPPQSSVTWSNNTVLRVVNYGAGAVTIDGGSGVTVTNTSSTIAQYGAAVAIRTGSDAWTVVPFGGGDIPAATVSSPAATGQYTDTGITYDYYTFTASGTLTVDTAGFVDVLVVGGGGGGGNSIAGGGGAGGHLYLTDLYLPAGSISITVGAGGAGSSTGDFPLGAANGIASRVSDVVYAVGGGFGNSGDGGSGGGGYRNSARAGVAVTNQGNNGAAGPANDNQGGGGGGAGAAGSGQNGGNGTANSITGSSVTRAGGGGGGGRNSGAGAGTGGTGGGGNGAFNTNGSPGSANTGGGGGGGGYDGSTRSGGNGGSGVVIVRVKV